MQTICTSPSVFFLLLGFAATGCQQDPGPQDPDQASQPLFESFDSAGIQIIENARPAEGSRLGWRIGPEPSVTIGVLEGEEPYLLNGAVSATKLPDGHIVVADGSSRELRMFDSVGTHVVTWGGEGEGPGEFWWLNYVAPWPGDSIVAWFPRRGGISVFDSDGSYGRSFGLWGDCPPGCPHPLAARRDGAILTTYPGEPLDSAVLQIMNGDGVLSASFEKRPDREVWRWTDDYGGTQYEDVAYGSVLAKGFWGDLVVASQTNRYEIRAFGADGALARIVRRDHAPRVPTPADFDLYLESEVAFYTAFYSQGASFPASEVERIVARRRRTLESAPMAETFPAFSSFIGDATGHLWVREYDFPGEARPAPLWTVFGPEGRVLGFIETPPGLRIFEIGADYILGRVRDELGVESVQVWPLRRSG